MAYRVRELTDHNGERARITLEPHDQGALLRLERPDADDAPLHLDIYGMEILSGFILSARLSAATHLPDEAVAGPFASHFSLSPGHEPRIVVEQRGGDGRFELPGRFWDRFHAELDLTIPHAKSLARRQERVLH